VSRFEHRSQLGPLADLWGPCIPPFNGRGNIQYTDCFFFQNILYAIHTFYHNVTKPKDSYSMFQYWDLEPFPEEIMCTL